MAPLTANRQPRTPLHTVLIAPTAFKGTLSAAAVASAIADGVRDAAPAAVIRELPLSDGGNGLLDALQHAAGGASRIRTTPVSGPLGEPVLARLLFAGDDVVVETADACGLHLLPSSQRDPLRSTTRGVGELLRAVPTETTRLWLGLGGSATVDGGAGMAVALGWRLLDRAGRAIPDGGAGLLRLHTIEPPREPSRVPPVVALCDVTNPLLGGDGASAVYAPQKGAGPEGVERLEAALAVLAERVRLHLGVDLARAPGVDGVAGAGLGAAGGLAAGIVAFLGGRLVSGATHVLEAVGFDVRLRDSGLVITGEGSYDAQSARGKIVGEVLRRAAEAGIPALLVAGRVELAPGDAVRIVGGTGETLSAARIRAGVAREVARVRTGR